MIEEARKALDRLREGNPIECSPTPTFDAIIYC